MSDGRGHTTERPADSGGERVQHPGADHAQEGALGRMQAEAIPAVGQRSTAAGVNAGAERGDQNTKTGQPSTLPELELTDSSRDSRAGGDVGDKERAVKGAAATHKDGALAPAKDSGPAKDSASAPAEQSAFTEVGRSKEFDPKKPTAAFIDVFDRKEEKVGPNTFAAHGEISRAAAEKNNFNTIALQFKDDNPSGATDFSKQFNQVADGIDKGTMPLGKGDVLNISMGNADPTFAEASKFLGFPVTGENLAAERGHILQRMGEIAKDPSRSKDDQDTASRVVRTNEAIDRVQSKGVEVIQAAGNFGKDQFSWDFMNAKTQLSSYKPSGVADSFSADHSLAQKSDGIFPVKYSNEMNLMDPTRLKNQKGTYEIGDTGVKFAREGKAFAGANDKIYDREKVDPRKPMDRATAESPVSLTSSDFDPHRTLTKNPAAAHKLGDTSVLPANKLTSGGHLPKVEIVKAATPESTAHLSQPTGSEQRAAGSAGGTSFANMRYLKEERDRLVREKAER